MFQPRKSILIYWYIIFFLGSHMVCNLSPWLGEVGPYWACMLVIILSSTHVPAYMLPQARFNWAGRSLIPNNYWFMNCNISLTSPKYNSSICVSLSFNEHKKDAASNFKVHGPRQALHLRKNLSHGKKKQARKKERRKKKLSILIFNNLSSN